MPPLRWPDRGHGTPHAGSMSGVVRAEAAIALGVLSLGNLIVAMLRGSSPSVSFCEQVKLAKETAERDQMKFRTLSVNQARWSDTADDSGAGYRKIISVLHERKREGDR